MPLDDLIAECDGAHVALVGNSSILVAEDRGAEIDAHDVVVRFNRGLPTPSHRAHTGSRTDVWCPSGISNIADLVALAPRFAPRHILWLAHWRGLPDALETRLSLASRLDLLELDLTCAHATTGCKALDFLVRRTTAAVRIYGFDFLETPNVGRRDLARIYHQNVESEQRTIEALVLGHPARLSMVSPSRPAPERPDIVIERGAVHVATLAELLSGHADERERALHVLVDVSVQERDQAAAIAADRLEDPAPGVRWRALSSLGRLIAGSPAGPRHRRIGDHLRSPEPVMRHLAARTLADLGATGFADAIAALLEDDDPWAQRGGVGAMGRLGLHTHAAALADFLGHPMAGLRREAIGALARLDHRAGLPAIARLLCDDVPDVRGQAARVLGLMAATSYASDIAALLDDSDAETAIVAIVALANLRATAHAPRIAALREHPHPWARAAAEVALQHVTSTELSPAAALRAPLLRTWYASTTLL